MPGKIAGFVVPGNGNNLATPATTSIPAAIAALGGNTAVIATTYLTSSQTGVDIDPTRAVSDDGITAQVRAARAAGLRVALKPHVYPAGGDIQSHLAPGCYVAHNTAQYRSRHQQLTIPGAGFDRSWVGRRVTTPTPGHLNEIPSGLTSPHGRSAPTWTVITDVIDSDNVTMSAAPAFDSNNGYVVIPDDNTVNAWFAAYQTTLDHLMTAATAAGAVDLLILSTEHDFAHILFEPQWRALIAHLRAAWPGVALTVGDPAVNGYNTVRFWDALDYIGLTWWRPVQAQAGGETLADLIVNNAAYLPDLAAFAAAWSKPILFTEIGYRSVKVPGWQPWATAPAASDGGAVQAQCVEAFLRTVFPQPWLAGFCYWNWSYAQPPGPGEASSFSPNGKPAETVFKTRLAAA